MNILPYMGIERDMTGVKENEEIYTFMPNVSGMSLSEAEKAIKEAKLELQIRGEGENAYGQFPPAGEKISVGSKVFIYVK